LGAGSLALIHPLNEAHHFLLTLKKLDGASFVPSGEILAPPGVNGEIHSDRFGSAGE
jgi:hypothetical protein